ncbi:MAG: hypothetical protein K1X79_12675, partial [Oligoflexia bacterium]|nr:hypothetical protein [Oligoflexia bacterium]
IRAGEELGFRSGFVLGGAEHGQAVPVDSAGYRETLLTSIIPPLDELKDTLTGAATKYSLLSERKLEAMLKRPGEHYLAFIDFAHMSVGNDVGLRDEVNALLERVYPLARECFGAIDPNFDLVRPGGDEFALHFAVTGAQTKERLAEALKVFKQKVVLAKREIFGDPDILSATDPEKAQRLVEAEHYAAIRHESRILRPLFEANERALGRIPRLQVENGLVGYGAWLISRLGTSIAENLMPLLPKEVTPECFGTPARATVALSGLRRERLEIIVSELENIIARNRVGPTGRIEFMFPRIAVVDLEAPCGYQVEATDIGFARSIRMSLALGKADKLVHQIQRGELHEDMLPHPITDDIKLKPDDRSEILALNGRIGEAGKVIEKLREPGLDRIARAAYLQDGMRLFTSDPSVEDTPRLSLVTHLKASALLPISLKEKRDFTILRFDLPGAGAVNNHSSYRDLDRIITGLAREARKLFPESLVLRVDGGSLYVFVPGQANTEVVLELRDSMNQELAKMAARLPFARLEFNQKQVLRDMVRRGQEQASGLAGKVTGPDFFRTFNKDSIRSMRFLEMDVEAKQLEIHGEEELSRIISRWRLAPKAA